VKTQTRKNGKAGAEKPRTTKPTPKARPHRDAVSVRATIPADVADELRSVAASGGMSFEVVAACAMQSFAECNYSDGFEADRGDKLTPSEYRIREAQNAALDMYRDPAMRAHTANTTRERIARVTAICCGICHENAASVLRAYRYPHVTDTNENDNGEYLSHTINATIALASLDPDEREVVCDAIEHHLRNTGHSTLIPGQKASPKNGKVQR